MSRICLLLSNFLIFILKWSVCSQSKILMLFQTYSIAKSILESLISVCSPIINQNLRVTDYQLLRSLSHLKSIMNLKYELFVTVGISIFITSSLLDMTAILYLSETQLSKISLFFATFKRFCLFANFYVTFRNGRCCPKKYLKSCNSVLAKTVHR